FQHRADLHHHTKAHLVFTGPLYLLAELAEIRRHTRAARTETTRAQ
ncbi:unnamed protein product, partial [Phaeothamnion confervicola]